MDLTFVKSYFIDADLKETLDQVRNNEESIKLPTSNKLTYNLDVCGPKCDIGSNLYSDIELFTDFEHSSKNSVYDATMQTHTQGGQFYSKRILSNPIHDPEVLKKRVNVLKTLAKKLPQLEAHLITLRDSELDLNWMFESETEEIAQLYDIVFFSTWFLRPFNAKTEALTSYNMYRILGSPTIGILSPITYVIIPFIILRFKAGLKISFFSYAKMMLKMFFTSDALLFPSSLSKFKYISYLFSLVFYFQGIFNSIELAKAVHHISKLIHGHVNGFINFVKASSALVKECDFAIAPFFTDSENRLKIDTAIDYYENYTPKPYSIFSNFGKQLSIYKFLKRDIYLPVINNAFIIDAIAAAANMIKNHTMQYASFINALPDTPEESTIRPYLRLEGFWHPSLKSPVKNTLELGGYHKSTPNIILTGPNAGGKSTIIKAILINTLFAQSLGIAFADHVFLVPFKYINSQINIPDCKGRESLFEAEMYRSKSNLEALETLDKKHTALIVMDEIFNSTNPVEGIAGAYAIAKHMASYSNASALITTHFLYLAKLAKQFPEKFTNYKMNVHLEGDNIKYPYKLTRGISRQYIALELLRKNGFDATLLDDAIKIKESLTHIARIPALGQLDAKGNIVADDLVSHDGGSRS